MWPLSEKKNTWMQYFDADTYVLLAGLSVPWTFSCTEERQIPNLTGYSL